MNPFIDHLVADDLDTRNIPEDPGMDSNPGKHAMVTWTGTNGVVRYDRIMTAKEDDPTSDASVMVLPVMTCPGPVKMIPSDQTPMGSSLSACTQPLTCM
jgi:hypothetical protein